MSQFSNTRQADQATSLAGNAYLAPAIAWLRANTAMGRMSHLEVYETLQNMIGSGGFTVTQNGHSITT